MRNKNHMCPEELDPWTEHSSFSNAANKSRKILEFLDVSQHDIVQPSEPETYICSVLSTLVFRKTMRTYLIVDATMRMNLTGVFDLDVTDLDIRCLFTGDAARDWKESAPYLIDITPSNAVSDVSDLCRQFFSKHWGFGTGIVLTTTASMDEVWRHLRRFTRVRQVGAEGWSLFRFWDPRVALPYFSGIRQWEDRSKRFFEISGTTQTLVMIVEHPGGEHCTEIKPSKAFPTQMNIPLPQFLLTDDDMTLLKDGVKQRFVRDVSEQAAEYWPLHRAAFKNDDDWQGEVYRLLAQANDAGLDLDRDIRDYIAITLDKGEEFWGRSDVRAILKKPHLKTPTLQMLAVRSKLEAGTLR